jgi:hypothetical protein
MPEFTDTKSYAAFKDGYNAGLARDEQSKDRILTNASDALYEDCRKIDSIISSNNDIDYARPPNVQKLNTDDLFTLYKNDVEFTNSFREQVLQDEKNYFEKKYSKTVYKYLLDKRSEYNKDNDTLVKTDANLCPTITNKKDVSGNMPNNYVEHIKLVYDKLTQFYPQVQSDTTYRKIEYRDEEHKLLMTVNSFINIIYYVLLFIMAILLASSNRLLIKERFLVYLLLIILPFLYPYIFHFCKKIFNSLFISKPNHGPKNAFVEIPPPNVDAFNI